MMDQSLRVLCVMDDIRIILRVGLNFFIEAPIFGPPLSSEVMACRTCSASCQHLWQAVIIV